MTNTLHEYGLCMADIPYTLRTYLQTYDKTQNGFVPFEVFPEQESLISVYNSGGNAIISKYRQAGVSTVTAAYCSHLLAFADSKNPDKILIMANKLETSQEMLSKIKDFLEQYPSWMGLRKGSKKSLYKNKNSVTHIKLHNGCEAKAVATSKDAMRGYTPTLLILDEAAFIEGGQDLWAACMASLSTGGRVFVISTPHGMDEIYYKCYSQAKIGDNDFTVVEMVWYEDPRYNKDLKMVKYPGHIVDWLQQPQHQHEYETKSVKPHEVRELEREGWHAYSSWFIKMCKKLNFDKRMIAQELQNSFLGSGDNVIDPLVVEKQRRINVKAPIVREYGNKLRIWAHPVEGHKYIAAIDVSRGDSADFSAIQIIDFDTMEQVLEYHGKEAPDELANLALPYLRRYNAFTVVDITGGMGVATANRLVTLGYLNLYYDNMKEGDQYKYNFYQDKTPGINYNGKRSQIAQALDEQFRGNLIVRSEWTCNETNTFVYINGKPDHMGGYHDDLLQALGMCCYVAQNSFTKLKAAEAQAKAMIESYSQQDGGGIQTLLPTPGSGVSPAGIHPSFGGTTGNGMNFVPTINKDQVQQNMWLFAGIKK